MSSRLLNEKSGWMGLHAFDLSVLGYLLVVTFELIGVFGFFVTGFAALLLVKLRLSHREKSIRDYVYYLYKRAVQCL